MRTVRNLMEQLKKLTEEDESWLDAKVQASHPVQISRGEPPCGAYLFGDFKVEEGPKGDLQSPVVWLTFSEGDFSDFLI